MTRDECLAGIDRMAKGIGEEPTLEKVEAIAAAFRSLTAAKWARVVDHCIAEYRRFPVLSEIIKAVDETGVAKGKGQGIVTSRACSCGGSLVAPTDGRSGHAWYRRELFEGDAEAGARDREMNPHLWNILLLRVCSTCRTTFAIACEDFEFLFADGSRGAVKKGQLTECGTDWLARHSHLQHVSDAPF